jgi:hypothetical protein
MVEELVSFLRNPTERVTARILQLRDALADLELKKYVESAILNRHRG